jgi:hypothetical protein
MNWKKLAWSTVVSTGLVMGSACGGDDDGPGPGTDSGMPMTDSGTTPMPLDCGDCFYVVNALDFGPGPEGRFPGFNIDGVDSLDDGSGDTECMVPDFIGYDGTPGVDNGLGGLLNAASSLLDVGAEIEAALAEGSVIILIEPMGVTSTEQANITLRLYLGETADGMAPMVDGMNRISADQVFNYLPEPDIMVPGRVVGGVIEAGPLDLPLSLNVMDMPLSLTIEDAQIRIDLDQLTAPSGGVTPNILGGRINLVALFETLGPLLPADVPVATLDSILRLYLDLDPVTEATTITITPGEDGIAGTEDDVTFELAVGDCGSISAGIGLEFVPAMKGTEVTGS